MKKHFNKLSYLICLLYLLTQTGCASIVSQNTKNININSVPGGAKIEILDERGCVVFNGKTPVNINLKTGESYFHAKSYTVNFMKEGYEQRTALITSTINSWYYGNILIGGLIGMLIVDPITGSMWTLNPEILNIKLDEKTVSMNDGEKHISVVTLNNVPEKYRDKLVQVH